MIESNNYPSQLKYIMTGSTLHNPDRYMIDLRQILSQGRKKVGFLIGAGAPTSIRIDGQGNLIKDGDPLIPDVARITEDILELLDISDRAIVDFLKPELGPSANIEAILTKIRRLSQAIGAAQVHGWDAGQYDGLAARICTHIGGIVSRKLPLEENPYSELVSWIGGTHRQHAVEVFTPNYDLLLEEAFERARLPYFDGFSGSHRPFFDPTSIAEDHLPSRWSRIWKMHGSLGWELDEDVIIRTGSRNSTNLIYPDHLKYDHIGRQPYSALFERLRAFLSTPDTLLICSGFSFFDAHITSVIDESLSANPHTAVLAFQYKVLAEEALASKVAIKRPNLSVYARDGAVVAGIRGNWQPGKLPSEEWANIRKTFWNSAQGRGEFLLGDFAKLARFCALAQASAMAGSVDVALTFDEPLEDEEAPAHPTAAANA